MTKQFNLLKIILVLFFLQNHINAQVPTWQWAKTTVGTNYQYSSKTVTDNSGNLYILGRFNYPDISFDAINLTTTSSFSLFISKYNSNGDALWAKMIESNSYLVERTLSIDNDNNLIIGGTVSFDGYNGNVYFDSGNLTLDFSTNTIPNSLYFVAKFDTDGNILWAKNNQGKSAPVSIATDDANNIYSLGYFESSKVTFEDIELNNSNNSYSDVFITKYNQNGIVSWAKSFGGIGNDNPRKIIKNSDGNFTIIGYFNSPTITFENTTLTNNGAGWNLFIAKIDSDGNIISAINGGTAPYDYNHFLELDQNDNFYLYGYFETPTIMIGGTVLTKIGDTDMYIAKYNFNGALNWVKNFGNVGSYLTLDDITTDSTGNIYLASDFSSPSITLDSSTYLNNGSYTSLILKLNENGDIVWGKSALGNSDINKGNFPTSILVKYNNDLFVTGAYNSQNVSFDNNIISNTDTHTKIYISSLAQPNLSNQEFNKNLVKLYPNPVNTILNIKGNSEIIGKEYSIIDAFGRIVNMGTINSETTEINTNNLKSGLYFIRIDNSHSYKFIKK